MIKKIVTDLHIGAVYEMEMPKGINIADPNLIFLGDIWDLFSCKHSEVNMIINSINNAKKTMKDRYPGDQHDAVNHLVSEAVKIEGVGYCGGSQLFWDEDRLHNYTQKEFGAGFLKRQVWGRMLKLASNFVSDKISDQAMDRAIIICNRLGVKKLVAGHKHPKKVLVRVDKGITLYVLPRGLTELDL